MDGRLVLAETGVHAAESLLIARTLMRPSVHFHHVSRIGEMMFQEAVMAHVGENPAEGIGLSSRPMIWPACRRSSPP